MKECIICISKYNIGMNGAGVITLVFFYSYTLVCKYCLNTQSMNLEKVCKSFSAEDLYEEEKKDRPYFIVTGSGITYSGGERYIIELFGIVVISLIKQLKLCFVHKRNT